jgi:hypothetical protein
MSKGGGGGTNTVQKADPWAGQQPYLTDLFSQAQQLYQQGPQQFYPGRTYAEASPTVYQAENLQRQAALAQAGLGMTSIVPGFQESLMSPTQRFQDPMFQEALSANLRPIEESTSRLLQQARRGATQAGQLGGTRQGILESEVLKDMLTKQSDVASKMYGDLYGDVLKTQAATLGMSPSIMSTFTQPASTLAQVGAAETTRAQQPITEAMRRFQFEQAAPGEALRQYAQIAGNNILPPTTTTSTSGPGGPGALAGGLGGAGLGYLASGIAGYTAPATGLFSAGGALGAFNPYILGGALLGGLLS